MVTVLEPDPKHTELSRNLSIHFDKDQMHNPNLSITNANTLN